MPHLCLPGQESARNALRKQREIVQREIEGVRVCDVDAIHDMRVGSRRLRMALKIYRPYVPQADYKALLREIRVIGRALGRRRELDVMVAMLKDHSQEAHGIWQRFMVHAIALLEERRAREQRSCLEAVTVLEGDVFQHAIQNVLANIDATSYCIQPLARDALRDALDAVHVARKGWKKSGEHEDLHEVRIAIKRFRYACEFHKSLYGAPMETYIERLKEAQATLGEWNECRLLEDMVLILGNAADYDIAQGAPLVAEAYGERAAVLEHQFAGQGKALFCKKGRKAFKTMLKAAAPTLCCPAG